MKLWNWFKSLFKKKTVCIPPAQNADGSYPVLNLAAPSPASDQVTIAQLDPAGKIPSSQLPTSMSSVYVSLDPATGNFDFTVPQDWIDQAVKIFNDFNPQDKLGETSIPTIAAAAMMNSWKFSMRSPRSFAFFFDIAAKDRGTSVPPQAFIADVPLCKKLMTEADPINAKLWDTVAIDDEMSRLFQIAYAHAKADKGGQYFHDVFARKGTIALGHGSVHGSVYSYNFNHLSQ